MKSKMSRKAKKNFHGLLTDGEEPMQIVCK